MLKLLIFFIILSLYFSAKLKPIDINSFNKKLIQVEIKGAIDNPGIFEIFNGATLNDLLKIVKLKENADLSSYNLNYPLSDNDVINIDYIKKINKISINNSDINELITLPGIGEKIALNIIEYRKLKLFQNINELMNVKGISKKKFEKICDLISL